MPDANPSEDETNRARWRQIAEALRMLSLHYNALWRAGIPSDAANLSPELERQVDAWCREIVRELTTRNSCGLTPHDYLKPWISARILAAEVGAAAQASAASPRPMESPQAALEYALIDWWHFEAKPRWGRLRTG